MSSMISSPSFGADALSEAEFCSICNVPQAKGCRHCNSCGYCVRGFDHHCMLLRNCVGVANRRLFFVYLLSINSQVATALTLATVSIDIYNVDYSLLFVFTILLIL